MCQLICTALRSDLIAFEHFVILESIEYVVVQYFVCVGWWMLFAMQLLYCSSYDLLLDRPDMKKLHVIGCCNPFSFFLSKLVLASLLFWFVTCRNHYIQVSFAFHKLTQFLELVIWSVLNCANPYKEQRYIFSGIMFIMFF